MNEVKISKRFRGFLPIVIDVETAGFDAERDALLEVACVSLKLEDNKYKIDDTCHVHLTPFEGANLDEEALKFNKIDPDHPFRFALSEQEGLDKIFAYVKEKLKIHNCNRAVVVGHNAWFDLTFLMAAIKRCKYKSHPFHSFTSFDTATLGGFFYGHTVLAKLCELAKIPFDLKQAHGALYDADRTALLFCKMLNRFNHLLMNERGGLDNA